MRSAVMLNLTRMFGFFIVCILFSAGKSAAEDFDAFAGKCNQTFTNETGSATISGKNFTHCIWQIKLKSMTQTAITFKPLQLAAMDYVVVYDGPKDENNTNVVVNVTGSRDTFLAVTFSKDVSIKLFHESKADMNVKLNYSSKDCFLSYMPAYARRVTAPSYLAGRGNLKCSYKMIGLDQSVDKVAALAFTQFNIVSGNMLVTDGIQTVNTPGSANPKLPDDFISNQTMDLAAEVFMNFTLNNSTVAQTFDAFFSTVDHFCSSIVNITSNTTVAVNIPADKSPLTDCRIILRTQPGNTLRLKLTKLELLSESDKVMITDGGSLGSKPMLDLSSLPEEGNFVMSSTEKLWLRLTVGELPGIRTFQVDAYEQEYGGRFYTDGNITMKVNSTQPTSYYQFISPGGQITLTFGQKSKFFPKASLDIYDGTQETSNRLMSFKTGTAFFPVTSSGRSMLLVARNFNGAQNFSAQYNFITQTCNSLSSGSSGQYTIKQVQTPASLCRWTVRPQTNSGFVILQLGNLTLDVNETVTVYSGVMESGMTIATFDMKSKALRFPTIRAAVNTGLEVVYKSNNTCKENCTAPTVTGSYMVTQQNCGGILMSPTGSLTSPNYPNLYSLNTDCVWDATNTSSNITSKQWLFLSFSDLQLAQGHEVKVKHMDENKTQSEVLATYKGMTLPRDIIVKADEVNVEFTSKTINRKIMPTTARGFQANYWKLDCGGNFTTTNATGNFTTPGYPKAVSNTTLCVWIIQFPAHGHNSTIRNSAQFQIKLSKPNKKMTNGVLTVYDGGSVRDPILRFNYTKQKTGIVIARTNTIVVVYNYTASAGKDGSGMGIYLNYSAFSCNQSEQCGGNGVCIHPDWVCDGVDNCGDMSDEKNCPGTKPNTGNKGLVKSYWIAVSLIMGLLFGAVLAFLIPAIYRRIKYPHYDQLRDLSAPVVT